MYEDGEAFYTEKVLNTFANSEPVILIGRGGSGTRLLSQLALSSGVFLGSKLNVSLDSEEWVEDIYKLVISATSATGIKSGSEQECYWIKQLRKRAATILRTGERSYKDIWGWKLPETILALPQVLKAFPNAYVIHLVRHPLTSSWRRTHMTSRISNPIGCAVLTAAYKAYGFDPANMDEDESYFHNVITWTYQVQQAYDVLNSWARSDRILYLRYEDICESEFETQVRMSDFLGLGDVKPTIPVEIDSGRINKAPAISPETEKAWLICGELATRLGYEYDVPPTLVNSSIYSNLCRSPK